MLKHLHPNTLNGLFLVVTGQPIPPHWTHARAANHLQQSHALATYWHFCRATMISATMTAWRHDSMTA